MPLPDPRAARRQRESLQNRQRSRVVAKSRRLDLRPVWLLVGAGLVALGLGLAGQARADSVKQRCYTLVNKPAHLTAASTMAGSPAAVGQPATVGQVVTAGQPVNAVQAVNVGQARIVDTLPPGQQVNTAYYVAPNGQPVLPSQSGSSGLGVMIDAQWYPEPDVSGYFYYVEIQGDASVYCEPGVPVVYQQPAPQAGLPPLGVSTGGVQVPKNAAGTPIAGEGAPSVPFGYAGAPGTVFQPVLSN